jgi:hypothetical protein
MTDNPGNTLVRGKEILASASGVPPLTLEHLTDSEIYTAKTSDRLRPAPDKLADGRRLQGDPGYADRAYGRVLRTAEGVFLQYWLWFYSAPELTATGKGLDGAWQLVQIELGSNEQPRAVATVTNASYELFQLPLVERTSWETVEKRHAGRTDHPVLYVSPLTHRLYFTTGTHRLLGRFDSADGGGREAHARPEPFGAWVSWPGRWGTTASGPRSPGRVPSWEHPHKLSHRSLVLRGVVAGPAALLQMLTGALRAGVRSAPPRAPVFEARLERGRVVVQYRLSKRLPANIFVTIDYECQPLASAVVDEPKRSGEIVVDLPSEVTTCVVRVSSLSRLGQRSTATPAVLIANEPDALERSIFRGIVDAQLRRPEVRTFASRLSVEVDELKEALVERFLDPSGDFWRPLASDLQLFRDARSAHGQRSAAKRAVRSAWRRIAFAASIVAIATLALAIGWSMDRSATGLALLLLATQWWAPFLLGYWTWDQWQRKARAKRLLHLWPAPAGGDSDEPLREARRLFERRLREKSVAPTIREMINSATRARYDDALDFGDEGLPELRVREYEVPTQATERLAALTERMRGGSIGIAGPRGAGKTTLINAYCEPQDANDRRLTAVLSAPIQYDARDFVLTLFANLCTGVLASGGSQPTSEPPHWRISAFWPSAVSFVLASAIAATATFLDVKSTAWLAVMWTAALALVILAGGLAVRTYRRRRPTAALPDLEAQVRAEAEANLREIRFQQSYSHGYSGKLGVPGGPELSVQKQDTLAARQASYPEIVERLRSFLGLAAEARGGAVVGIDEMDKMESGETAQRFLNEIKGIFGVANCFYLVSISEGAMSSFERRGLPFRDVFDSSFDEVLRVTALPLAQSKLLLRRRVVGLAPPYLDLCHCLSGGLARDLLRCLRQLSLYNGRGMDLEAVSRALVVNELERKVEAATVSARQIALEPHVSALLFWLESLPAAEITPGQLIARSATLPEHWTDVSAANESSVLQLDLLDQLRLELAGLTYFLATVLEFFATGDKDRSSYFQAAELGEDDGSSEIDRLAQARVAFSVNPRVAISLVDRVRDSHRWPTLGFGATGIPTDVGIRTGSGSGR